MPPVEEVKNRGNAVSEDKLRDYLFKAAIHSTSGESERLYILKRELQHSKIGQQILPFWSRLDEDTDGKITENEWAAFFDKASETELGKEIAATGGTLAAELFLD